MSGPSEPRDPDPAVALADALAAQGAERTPLLVAWSGGPDSTLLLAVAAERGPRRRVRAIHIDHGWHEDSAAWAEHCTRIARELGVQCRVLRIDSRPRRGEGAEAAARAARYAALASHMHSGEVLLTAHHADDQAETVLFGLLRGGGIRALAGMPVARRFGAGWHLRPFLDLPRAALRAALATRQLDCIDDPANRDTRHDRVFLRKRILPLLRERWPRIERGLVRSGGLAAEAVEVEEALAAHDYVAVRGRVDGTLDCAGLLELSGARQRALVRWWLRSRGLPVPPSRRLESALAQFAAARPGRNPRIVWSGAELRRWAGQVWALGPRPDPQAGSVFHWTDTGRCLELPERVLEPEELRRLFTGQAPPAAVTLRRRRGGERLRPAGGRRERALTDLLREAGLPPWDREMALLVEHGGRLAGVLAPGLVMQAAPE